VNEELEPDLEAVIDIRFAKFEAELFVIVEYSEAIERQLPLTINKEIERLEDEITGADDWERPSTQRWIQQYTEEELPRLFRAPIIVALWAVFESAILEVAKHLQKEGRHSLGIEDLRGENVFVRAEKYYDHILHFPLIKVEHSEAIEMLLVVRNVIAHINGRIEAIKIRNLQKIRSWEHLHGGISTDLEYLSFTAEFVEDMAYAVKASLEDLITRVRAK
jgi:hypothetical protein